jgi:hypothetical protein
MADGPGGSRELPGEGLEDMDDQPSEDRGDHDNGPFAIDPKVPRLARVENYLSGGEAHFAADEAAAQAIGDLATVGLDGMRRMNEAIKSFVGRAVTVLAGDLGIRQFLHIGMSTPTTGMVHHVAAKAATGTRVVYVSHDPTVLAHVHALGDDVADGVVAHINRPLNAVGPILDEAGAVVDLAEPIGVVLPTTLNLIAGHGAIRRFVVALREAIVPGSCMVVAHTSLDLGSPGTGAAITKFNELLGEHYAAHSATEITGFLEGFELLDPGLVPIERWRPDDPGAAATEQRFPIFGVVGRRT